MTISTTKINLLDKDTQELIAAGEVIERPLSVIKEMVENSIDAGSSKITVSLKMGGHGKIIITDDGCGMNAEDARNALKRFATSKIKKIDDLEHLSTLGFRGEALPSAAAVSKMEIFTNDGPDKPGTHLVIEGGKIISEKETPYQKGTKIIVSDLFFNTPARRKFQKSPASEFTLIYDLIYKLALYYKDIHFVLVNNDKESLNLPVQLDTLTKFAKFSKQDKDNFIHAQAESSSAAIQGFISSPEAVKKNKLGQVVFINGRIIKISAVNQALNDAYSQFTEKGYYPFALLFVEINPSEIDVNVHPAKSEVRFANSHLIYRTVFNAITQKLKMAAKPLSQDFRYAPKGSSDRYSAFGEKYDTLEIPLEYLQSEAISNMEEKTDVFGQINKTYAYAVINDELIIIDTHAAHERINYEYFKNKLNSKDAASQKLLAPVTFELTPGQREIFKSERETFLRLGFEMEEFGDDTYIVRSIPLNVKTEDTKTFLQDLFCELEDEYFNYKSADDRTDNMLKTMACKASVTSGKVLNYYEIKELFERLCKTEIPSNCPHGRPAYVRFTDKELNKMFKRT